MTESIPCGYTWADWTDTAVPTDASVCESNGGTSTFPRDCVYVNSTHEELGGNTPPAPTSQNCADSTDITRTWGVDYHSDVIGCEYLMDRKDYEILDNIERTIGVSKRYRAWSKLRLDLLLHKQSTPQNSTIFEVEVSGNSSIRLRRLHIDSTAEYYLKLYYTPFQLISGPFSIFDKWFEVSIGSDPTWQASDEKRIFLNVGSYKYTSKVVDGWIISGDGITTHKLGNTDGKIRSYRYWTSNYTGASQCLSKLMQPTNAKCVGATPSIADPNQSRFVNSEWTDCIITTGTTGSQYKYTNKLSSDCTSGDFCDNIFIPPNEEVISKERGLMVLSNKFLSL